MSAKVLKLVACALTLIGACATAPRVRAELIVNGGFEDGLSGWTFTGNGINDIASLSTDTPSGAGNSADLDINRGAFGLPLPWLIQDVAVVAGSPLKFSASVREVEAATPNDAWIAAQIWMLPSADSGSILSSAAMFFTSPDWTSQSTEITVPAGATIARILFTPQNPAFGVGNGQYRVDDVSVVLNVVPEPSSMFLFVVGCAIAKFRRRNR